MNLNSDEIIQLKFINKKHYNVNFSPVDLQYSVPNAWNVLSIISKVFCGRICHSNCPKKLTRKRKKVDIFENKQDLKFWEDAQLDLHNALSCIPVLNQFAECPACSIVDSFSCFPLYSLNENDNDSEDLSFPCFKSKDGTEKIGRDVLLYKQFSSFSWRHTPDTRQYIIKSLYPGIAVVKFLHFLKENLHIYRLINFGTDFQNKESACRKLYLDLYKEREITVAEFQRDENGLVQKIFGYTPPLPTIRRMLKPVIQNSKPGRRRKIR